MKNKKYRESLTLIEKGKTYNVAEAIALVKQTSKTKFDSSVQLSFNLGIDARQADQQIRGTIVLPHGNGKTKKILAVTNTKTEEAKAAGADFVGGKEILQKVQSENWFDFDVIVATPDMMGELGKMGKLLGPKGLMPNPKTGTVAVDIASAIKEIKAGKIEYRTDKEGNMHLMIGKVSFSDEFLADNIKLVIETLIRVKPSACKGTYIKNAVVHSTMGPAIKLAI